MSMPYRMTPKEIAWGWVPGGDVAPEPLTASSQTPIGALEDAIRLALLRPPCIVLFSGGCDSSLLLAVAIRLARREGHPEPIALTRRYPGVKGAEEDDWQELVIRHLNVASWEKHDATSSHDLLGADARASLVRHGVVWPPLVHTHRTVLAPAANGSIVTGEGGDEIFGTHRLAPLRVVARRRVPIRPKMATYAALAVSPQFIRRAAARQILRKSQKTTWLRPRTRREMVTLCAKDVAEEPLDWRAAVQRHPRLRPVRLAGQTMRAIANEVGVQRIDPLLDPVFLSAYTTSGGRFGPLDRTTALFQFFSDLLPSEVLARTSKGRFNQAAFGIDTRAFVDSFDGAGLDPDLVDADALMRTWRSDEPNALSFALLQSCWLATQSS
jgi:Asparagine synthase